jgi:hypothetical protein
MSNVKPRGNVCTVYVQSRQVISYFEEKINLNGKYKRWDVSRGATICMENHDKQLDVTLKKGNGGSFSPGALGEVG